MRAAVAALPAGQRRAVALHYYAGLPAGQIAEPAGAARVSLHKARRRLRAYLTEHRPDLVPAARRTPMTTVRIAGAERRIPPGPVPIGCPPAMSSSSPTTRAAARCRCGCCGATATASRRFGPPAAGEERSAPRRVPPTSSPPAAARGRRQRDRRGHRRAGPRDARVTRIHLASPAGSRQVTARVAEGLAVAITSGAPVRVADTVMDRLAVPLPEAGPVPLPKPAAALAVLSPGRPAALRAAQPGVR